jgi:hypothetical protein
VADAAKGALRGGPSRRPSCPGRRRWPSRPRRCGRRWPGRGGGLGRGGGSRLLPGPGCPRRGTARHPRLAGPGPPTPRRPLRRPRPGTNDHPTNTARRRLTAALGRRSANPRKILSKVSRNCCRKYPVNATNRKGPHRVSCQDARASPGSLTTRVSHAPPASLDRTHLGRKQSHSRKRGTKPLRVSSETERRFCKTKPFTFLADEPITGAERSH